MTKLLAAIEILAFLAGAVLVSAGAWWIYQPAGLITGGVLLLAGTILRARGSGSAPPAAN